MLDVSQRILFGLTYGLIAVLGAFIGWIMFPWITEASYEYFFHNTLSESWLAFSSLIGAVATVAHFARHWDSYFYFLQDLKYRHRRKYGERYGNLFLEDAHTASDLIYTISYVILDGLLPLTCAFLGAAVTQPWLTHVIHGGDYAPWIVFILVVFIAVPTSYGFGQSLVATWYNPIRLMRETDYKQ